ncbi:MAG: histidinol-phosphate transaminase [Turicibacter sp.]|nr:histidinol-phosphate transaminase [Turicibacter sp.]
MNEKLPIAKPQFGQLHAYVPGKTKGGVKLSANENPFGHSPQVTEVLANFQAFSKYPDGSASLLKEKVSQFLGVEAGQLIFGAGADEVIQMISRTLLMPGDNIIQANPTFSQYEHHAIIEGAQVRNVPVTSDGFHDLGAMYHAIDEKTKIIWVCNPNNPTGTYLSDVALNAFLKQVPSRILVVLDEAYAEYATAKDFPNSMELLKTYPNVMVLRTFSKIFGLASFRVGYGVGNPELISSLDVGRLPFNVSTIGQLVAAAAIDDTDFVKECAVKNAEGLKQYEDFFNSKGISYNPSQANFIFIPTGQAKEIGQKLETGGYIIRVFKDGIRITIGKPEDNQAIIELLETIFG